MSDFLLVHGSWHGAWCWERLDRLLAEAGHRVRAIDLPAHGKDRTPYWRATLEGYAARIHEAAAELDRPILVGHSMGGAAITRAASDEPRAFSALVYVCAFVPRAGQTVYGLSRGDRNSWLDRSMSFRATSARFRPERAHEVLYSSCREGDAAWATARLRPDPLRPLMQRMKLANAISCPRTYVECTEDRTVTISLQRSMVAGAGFDRVLTMKSDHSPFLSAPPELAAHLVGVADSI
ncbi:MAG: alpha/beta fold hydrolase [Candidatus Binatia bacterium]